MLKMLKSLCVLLKVLMLMKVVTVSSSEDLEDHEISNIPEFQINEHYMSPNIEIVEQYYKRVTVRSIIENVPSEPTFPRTFVDFNENVNKRNISVTFRWKKPAFTGKEIKNYTVEYWFIENLTNKKEPKIIDIPATKLQLELYDLKPNTMYYFKVRAHNEFGAGSYTTVINVSTTYENPVPRLLVNSSSGMKLLDMDLQLDFILNEYRAVEIAYSALERKIYWIDDKMQLMTTDLNTDPIETKQNYTKITDLDAPAYNLCIDYVARNLYWIQISNETNIMKLDLTLLQFDIIKYDKILINGFKFFNILPSSGYLYWIGLNSNNEYMIMQSNFNEKNIKPLMKNINKICFCQYKLSESSSLQIDSTDIDNPLLYWTSKNLLIVTDIYGCTCNLIFSAENDQVLFNYITIDKTNIYLYSNNEQLIYILEKKYALLETKENSLKIIRKVNMLYTPDTHKIIAFGKSLQPYPPMICLIPHIQDYHIEVTSITANSISMSLPEPILNSVCEKYNLATTIYIISVSYLTCSNNNLNKFEQVQIMTYERYYKIENLMPFTEHTLKLALSNFYIDKLSMNLLFGSEVILRTSPDKPNAPENVTVRILTPTLAIVYWMPPKELNCMAVNYEVHVSWMSVYFPNNTQTITSQTHKLVVNQTERTVDNKFFMLIQPLLPGQNYLVYVRVYPVNFSDFFNDSLSKSIRMYSKPNKLILSEVSTNGMNISWIPSNLTIRFILEYKSVAMQKWQIADNITQNNDKITYYIQNLKPQTLYEFRLNLRYSEYKEDFIWPTDGGFIFKTLGDVPSAPGKPTLTRLPNFMYMLSWKSMQDHHSQVTLYRLEGSVITNYNGGNQNEKTEHWNLYYNGTDNYWIITGDMNQKYRFRVRAENAYGFGEWSELSAVIDLTQIIEILIIQYVPLILSLVVTFVVYGCYFYCSIRQCKKSISNKKRQVQVCKISTSESEYPFSGNIQHNPLYDSHYQYDNIRIIKITQISIKNLLGTGAFGKVYQGIVYNLEGSTPAAIKMLNNYASSREIKGLLREAKIISQFCHKHVLKLLGICLDADSPWLILELMETDLLTYLRENQTLNPLDPQTLHLQDLLSMCEDVARGCCYLEQMRYVHRDLACRNCLISTGTEYRKNRIVKIGDFGLIRNMYNNQYYRMEGGDPLPIRWMAPESILYRKFSSKSDVWAFGVLMWEIMSLGKQPYFDKNNHEIITYIRDGGRLSQPLNCPSTLYQLMQQCWSEETNRPNFNHCLGNIESLRNNTEDEILKPIITYPKLSPSKRDSTISYPRRLF